jgi:hypothetical protein
MKGIRSMAGKVRKQTAVILAVASLGIAALTGCTSGPPTPQRTVLTTKSAGTYYLATMCPVNVAADAMTATENTAEASTSETGPDLDSLKAAALAYANASRAAANRLDNPKVVWPASVRKSILVLRHQFVAEVPPLSKMATATKMSDEAADTHGFPDTTNVTAAIKHIRSTLGLPSDASNDTCAAPGSTPSASSVAPASGVLVNGAGGAYTFHAPLGWTIPKNAPQADAYVIAAEPDAKGFYDTINVLPAPSTTLSLDEEEQGGVSYLKQVMKATQVQVRPRVTIDGVEGVHLSSLQTQDGVALWSEQYRVNHGGIAFTINFDFHETESQAVREALAESVLASWTWT